MKTSTLLLIGGAVAVGYYLSKRKTDATGTAAGASSLARGEPSPPTTNVIVMPPDINDDYGSSWGWGWAPPTWGARAWGGRRGHGPGGHGHGGHGHGGHH